METGTVMGFIIRCAFWLSLVLLIIPFGGSLGGGAEAVGPIQAFVAVRGAMDDVSGMCERRPDVCAVGRAALSTIGYRAKESARMAFEALEDNGDARQETVVAGKRPTEPLANEEIMTGSIVTPDRAPTPVAAPHFE